MDPDWTGTCGMDSVIRADDTKATVGEEPEAGVLYVVPTPLGHLGDLSPRASHILRHTDVLLAEDTRVSRKLLSRIEARPRLVSCHDHNERARVVEVVRWLSEGERVALVSDAGTPLVSDPGFCVVQGVLAAGIRVVALPGPVAALTALSGSGLAPDRFSFVGFVPRKKKAAAALLSDVVNRPDTLLFYCSCHRLRADLAQLQSVLGDREAVAARDLTKRGELYLRGKLSELGSELAGWSKVTGEWTVCVAGAVTTEAPAELSADVLALIEAMVGAGMEARRVRDLVQAATGVPKKLAYRAVLDAAAR